MTTTLALAASVAMFVVAVVAAVVVVAERRRRRREVLLAEFGMTLQRVSEEIGKALVPALQAMNEPLRQASDAMRQFGEVPKCAREKE